MDKNVERAPEALDILVKTAGGCEDSAELHKQAVAILGAKLGTSEGPIKNVCRAFNSNKAVYKHSTASDETRGNDYTLLNPDLVFGDICKIASAKAVKKVANKSMRPTFTHIEPKATTTLKKAASAGVVDPAEFIDIDPSIRNMSLTICNTLNGAVYVINKIATGIDIARSEYCVAVDNLNRTIAGMPKQAAADLGSLATAKYGALLHDVQWGCKELKKYASAPKMPEGGIYDRVSDVAQKSFVLDSRKELLKQACADFAKAAVDLAGAYNLQRYSMRKKADGLSSRIIGTAIGSALPDVLGLKGGISASNYEELMNPNVRNVLRELELKRNFFEVYDDDYISTFPLEQVQAAYNMAIQKLPDKMKKHPSSATQLIRSWVTKQLSHGGVTSAEDAADVLQAAESLRNERLDINPYTVA